jgi:hypothetical protein
MQRKLSKPVGFSLSQPDGSREFLRFRFGTTGEKKAGNYKEKGNRSEHGVGFGF